MLLICLVLLTVTWICRVYNFVLWSGLSYFRIFTICLLLVYFVSAAGCHCFDLSTWMTYLKNILNGPGLIQGVKWWIWPKIIHFDRVRVIFLKTKNNRSIWICLKYYISTSFLSTLTTYVKNMSNWPDPGDQMMDMTQNYSLWPHKGNFSGKTKKNRNIWICLKYNLSTSLLSTLMTNVKNILNWLDPGSQMMDMTQDYSLWLHKGNFPAKAEINRSTWKYNLCTSLLSTLMTYLKNILNWPDLGGQMMDMTQNYSLWLCKGNFPGKTKNNRSTWICLKYNLSASLLSTLMTYVKNMSNWTDPGGQMMDMTQNYSLWPHKGNFPGKTKNNRSIWICLKYSLSTSLLSTLMTYLKNVWSGPDPGGQMMDMTPNYSLWLHTCKGLFPGKTKNNGSIWICLKYNLGTSLLSTLMTYVKNILNWPDPGGQMMDMTQNCSLLWHKGNFPGISKNNKTTQICFKYGLRCAGASILERCLKNNRLSPKTMVQKNLSLKIWVWVWKSESGDIQVTRTHNPRITNPVL